ncbi:SDR family NAD(P)-dependent oxidoreductase [Phreatobacter cathodiphilus]|uniref:Oxidoreductase n=1 Tax=Phreatobacter cathodiphilus TaxID=1868589 RepID=A0A2S0N705_9HYPH|nr:SDR family NAD(P)-dependent oxidoreductase [Phreatobacter cathodiphilus]AVO43723.1 oxidoreductase [Phreatobacter cathodiphilus]
MDFTGKVALVTGGASGIGEAATRAFAKAGAKVAFTYISSGAEANALEKEIAGAGGQALAIKADLTRQDETDAAFAAVVRAFGTVDVVFTNAGGILQRIGTIESSLDLWQRAFDLNVMSTYLTCQAAVKIMAEKKSGAIVTMSSLAAMDGGGPGALHYASSKGAIVTYTRALAKELGPLGIRVNGVAPGLIDTRFHVQFNTPEGRKAAVEGTPLRREGTAEDVANLVVFLASDKAAFITGETVQINGGRGLY